MVVLAIGVPAVTKLSSEDSQRLIAPAVWPLNVKVVKLFPKQTVALPAMVPPTNAGITIIVPVAFNEPQLTVNGML